MPTWHGAPEREQQATSPRWRNGKANHSTFANAASGHKPFEARFNDRDYQTGDKLRLREYDPVENTYSGQEVTVMVTFVLAMYDGLIPGYCIMGIRKMPPIAQQVQNFMKLMNSDELGEQAKALGNQELANRIANEVQSHLSFIEMPYYLIEEAMTRLDPTLKNETQAGA